MTAATYTNNSIRCGLNKVWQEEANGQAFPVTSQLLPAAWLRPLTTSHLRLRTPRCDSHPYRIGTTGAHSSRYVLCGHIVSNRSCCGSGRSLVLRATEQLTMYRNSRNTQTPIERPYPQPA
ncbi:hypothetical protein BAUCODRAFT_36817 [Baudoinia panamericana UAMH 10762]|uniref:Uncharacterized protein n=1 Tax=Baudoinia panamericana (strain UAMH 10762) TaxID=717646 RepID=M2M9P5_BAUPA|nr:uncharacterized protein BAUCODRAFT_36817 [Baudoinia panamericana UAMH 10762]EMC93151.1 hypothetical protein BAUCODRAFT_36817 [Baudoinia panamericana UAMH 10762]